MADSPNDFRDPHVSKTESSGGIGKWIGIALAVLLGLLLLAWLFGAFDDDIETTTVPAETTVTEPATTTTTEPDAVVVVPEGGTTTTDDAPAVVPVTPSN